MPLSVFMYKLKNCFGDKLFINDRDVKVQSTCGYRYKYNSRQDETII